jgi:hypothetical protein
VRWLATRLLRRSFESSSAFLFSVIAGSSAIRRSARTPPRFAALGAPHFGEHSEPELIRSFVDRIQQLTPQLVTFNGSGFDLPVLRYRAMINRVPAPGLQARPYFDRYTTDAIDLCDVRGSFSGRGKMKLDELILVDRRQCALVAVNRASGSTCDAPVSVGGGEPPHRARWA